MDISRFTERARAILQSAQGLATERSHQFITPTHLGLSLLDDETGLVPRLMSIASVETEPARAALLADLIGHAQSIWRRRRATLLEQGHGRRGLARSETCQRSR